MPAYSAVVRPLFGFRDGVEPDKQPLMFALAVGDDGKYSAYYSASAGEGERESFDKSLKYKAESAKEMGIASTAEELGHALLKNMTVSVEETKFDSFDEADDDAQRIAAEEQE